MFILNYIDSLLEKLKSAFGTRLLYVGLQGSHLRREATCDSDIDIMAIIDDLGVRDLDLYKEVLISVGDYERSCGFICSPQDLAHWNPMEICHLLHTTGDLYGRLADHVPDYTRLDVKNYVKLSVGNLYHEICHRQIHADEARRTAGLPYSYKGVFFILQNLHYLETCNFIQTKSELREHLNESDCELLDIAERIRDEGEYDYDYAFSRLFSWCRDTLKRADQI